MGRVRAATRVTLASLACLLLASPATTLASAAADAGHAADAAAPPAGAARAGGDPPEADVSPTHAAAIRELIDVTGSLERELARVGEIVAALRGTAPDLPAAVWTNYAARLSDREALLALYVPAYARHLDEADTRAWLAFHRTPLGGRVLAAQEPIREASRAAAQRLAADVFAELDGDAAPEAAEAAEAADAAEAAGPSTRASAPAIAPSHAAAIRELIDVTGALGSARGSMRKLLDAVRASPFARSTPPEFWARAAERMTEPEALYALWVPAYAAHLPETDVSALLAFYRTPAGARIAAAQPTLHADVVDVAQRYGATSARRAVRDVLGPLPQWRPPAPHDDVR